MKSILFAILFLVVACSPPVVFEQAYPPNGEDLQEIPKDFRGAFICESDSALLVISPLSATLHKTIYFEESLSKVREKDGCEIIDNKMYVAGRRECIPLEMINDSTVRGVVEELDTLFVIQKGSSVREHKGHLIVNQEFRKDKWEVSIISQQENGDLVYKAITPKSSIKRVNRITPATEITTSKDKRPKYSVNPTLKQFDALFNDEKIFIECEYLTRVKL